MSDDSKAISLLEYTLEQLRAEADEIPRDAESRHLERVEAPIERMQRDRMRPRIIRRAEQVSLEVRVASETRWREEHIQMIAAEDRARAEAERARAYASRPGWLRAVIQAVCRIW